MLGLSSVIAKSLSKPPIEHKNDNLGLSAFFNRSHNVKSRSSISQSLSKRRFHDSSSLDVELNRSKLGSPSTRSSSTLASPQESGDSFYGTEQDNPFSRTLDPSMAITIQRMMRTSPSGFFLTRDQLLAKRQLEMQSKSNMKFESNSVDSGSMDFIGGAVEGQSESNEVDLFSQVFRRQRAASSQINATDIKLKSKASTSSDSTRVASDSSRVASDSTRVASESSRRKSVSHQAKPIQNVPHVKLEIDSEFEETLATSGPHSLPSLGQYQPSSNCMVELEKMKQLCGDLILDQMDLETEAAGRETNRYQLSKDNVTELGRGSEMGPAKTLLRSWFKPLVARLKENLAAEGLDGKRKTQITKNLSQLSAEKLAIITLNSTIGQLLRVYEGVAYSSLAASLAESVQAQLNYEKVRAFKPEFLERKYGPKYNFNQRQITTLSRKILRTPTHGEEQLELTAEEIRRRVENGEENFEASIVSNDSSGQQILTDSDLGSSLYEDRSLSRIDGADHSHAEATKPGAQPPVITHWAKSLKLEIGKFLLEAFQESATFTYRTETGVSRDVAALEVEVPKTTAKSATLHKIIRLADPILQNINYEHVLQEANHIRHYPMLTPPRPWNGPEDGGYYLYPSSLLRYYNYEQQVRPLYENHDQLAVLYEALTALGETPWRINNDVYNVVKQSWAEGGAVADIPSRQDLPMPVPGIEGKSPRWYKQIQKIQIENYNLHSLRCDLLLKLQVAEKFQNDVIYFPHNMDFRGRVYPIPPHLNHMGSDLSRGLLTFAEGKPLGKRGLYWLKIQLANLYGQDKIPFNERITFAEEHLSEVEDSATRPLRGRRWWLKAEDPWQCLACCFELHNALKHPDGPENYISHLPIHQDGTCNGLQHYAALGGDEQGAKSVNLLPADRPQDVYSDVALLVQGRIAQDASNGVEIAKLLKGQVNRRIIKQTVMTSVYGVTFVGARQQIANALKDRGVLDEDSRYEASVYLAKATFDSIGEMFTGARAIMDWFATCASLVAKRNRLVSWVTPLGLPVVQPYKKTHKKNVVKTAFQSVALENEAAGPVNPFRQRSAFPPNFVHSLDSSHMLLTAIACKRKGIVFSSVHDSYWAHACNIDKMNVELREAFVELHRRPILQRLLDHFSKHNPDINFPPIPERGGFDLDLVKQSPYFFN